MSLRSWHPVPRLALVAGVALGVGAALAPRGVAAQEAAAAVVRPVVASAPAIAAIAATAAPAARAAAFAGRWALNEEDSAFGTLLPAPTLLDLDVSVRHDMLRVRTAEDVPGFEGLLQTERYPLDGRATPERFTSGERGDGQVTFVGDTLVLTQHLERRGLAVTVTDQWALAATGTRLGVSRHITGDGVDESMFLVFDRAE